MPAFFLSESDVVVIKKLLDEAERRGFNLRSNAPTRTQPSPILQTPGSYIAFSPYGETLPAMVGTTPGKLLCDIYRIIDTEEIGYEYGYLLPPYEYEYDSSQVVQVEELTQYVYNISDSPMSGAFLVHKDKYGAWIAGAGGGGGGTKTIQFEITNWCPDIMLNTGCECVLATVIRSNCGSDVQAGDDVYIWDPDLCWLNLPITLLVGLRGTAIQMNYDFDPDVATGCTSQNEASGTCRWIVIGLCCAEEVYV